MTKFYNEGDQIKVRMFRKVGDIEELNELVENSEREFPQVYTVEKVEMVDTKEYEELVMSFMADNEIYERFSATNYNPNGVLVLTDGIEAVVVDPQGYDYARYVGVIVE